MPHLNIEFKARTSDLAGQEKRLQARHPHFVGEDHQVDTYFNVPNGRLKLREGNIEHALIHYEREDTAGAKASHVQLYAHAPDPALKTALTRALGIKVVVDKRRRIYFIDNVKFHFDTVAGLGTFIEVEAIDLNGQYDAAFLERQCREYSALLEIGAGDYVAQSYSDLLLALGKSV
jgi:adenylate cyclase class 2